MTEPQKQNGRPKLPPLTPETEAARTTLIRSKQLEASFSPVGWLSFLPAVAKSDARRDTLRGWCGGLAIGVGICCVITFFMLEELPWVVPVFAGMMVTEVALISGYFYLRSADIPNSLRKFVVPLLRTLREDMDPQGQLKLRLDLRGRMRKELRQRSKGAGITWDTYVDPWMAGETRLVDGSHLRWEIVDHTKAKIYSKRSKSGKLKTKTKYWVRTRIDVCLELPRKRYRPADLKLAERFNLSMEEKGSREVVTVRKLIKTKLPDEYLALGDFLSVIGRAYTAAALKAKGGEP